MCYKIRSNLHENSHIKKTSCYFTTSICSSSCIFSFFKKDIDIDIDAGRLSEDEIIALRDTYSTYDSKPSNVVFAARRTPMELILQATELIVAGEIIEDSGEYPVDIIIDPSDPDYERKHQILVTEGINIGIRYYNDYKIKVHETWYRDPSVKEITGIIPEISLGRTPLKRDLREYFI